VPNVCFEVSVEPFEAFLSHHSDSSKCLLSEFFLYFLLPDQLVAVLLLFFVPESHDQDVLLVGDRKVALIVFTSGFKHIRVLIVVAMWINQLVGFSWISEFYFIIISFVHFFNS